ncbi:dUTP diphosphatase [Methylorubrum suomiense]|uniref:Deoxyuridine 5'-triphosphate nucleotidohydrolase n=1 Tax=Methylorubrum suomiense TaxID=144191 RepID=A0ABQ4V223_9HYPH|nr:dUTP diphosphatase [Methylorubrum suomiense]GJE78115.1 Deoxyuridine 5'-triphosphate nucleotidohydrolase [Methylorubrum suomiense]
MTIFQLKFPLKIRRLSKTAIIPSYGSEHAAGMDLHCDLPETLRIHPGEHVTIPTNIAMAIPPNWALLICPRSGLSSKHGITVHNGPGVIDADYRGGIGVVLHNTNRWHYDVKPGDRIAQGVLVPIRQALFEEVDSLDETVRGAGGFGSTGVDANVPIKLPVQPHEPEVA